MGSAKYEKEYQDILYRLHSLPLHSEEKICETANRLRMLHYSFGLGNIHVDLYNTDPETLEKELETIYQMSFDDLVLTRDFEKEYVKGDRQTWAEYSKLYRMRLVLSKYEFLVRLREDDAVAWAEVT